MTPFLTVLTRTFRRPRALAANQASLAAQTDPDYEQILLPDDVGRGVAWANAQMRGVGYLIGGQYVMVLDDDDRLVDPALIADLKAISASSRPSVIVTRMDHGELGVLPGAGCWGGLPERGCIGTSAAIVRADVWLAHAGSWGESYDGDYDFVRAVLGSGASIHWHDRVVSAISKRSMGAAESV